MMEDKVVTQKTSLLLKEAGMPQEGGEWYWCLGQFGWLLETKEFALGFSPNKRARAFLTDESGKLIISSGLNLPIWDYAKKEFVFHNPKNIFTSNTVIGAMVLVWLGDNEAEARGKLILELSKEGVRLW